VQHIRKDELRTKDINNSLKLIYISVETRLQDRLIADNINNLENNHKTIDHIIKISSINPLIILEFIFIHIISENSINTHKNKEQHK
jgi:hypothetical protein